MTTESFTVLRAKAANIRAAADQLERFALRVFLNNRAALVFCATMVGNQRAAADALDQAVDLQELVRRELHIAMHGHPPQPERPRLRLIGEDDTAA